MYDCYDFSLAATATTPDGAIVPLPALVDARLDGVPDVTDDAVTAWLPGVRTLMVRDADDFVGAALGGLADLEVLEARKCRYFTGTGLPALHALTRPGVHDCPRFAAGTLAAGGGGLPSGAVCTRHCAASR